MFPPCRSRINIHLHRYNSETYRFSSQLLINLATFQSASLSQERWRLRKCYERTSVTLFLLISITSSLPLGCLIIRQSRMEAITATDILNLESSQCQIAFITFPLVGKAYAVYAELAPLYQSEDGKCISNLFENLVKV